MSDYRLKSNESPVFYIPINHISLLSHDNVLLCEEWRKTYTFSSEQGI